MSLSFQRSAALPILGALLLSTHGCGSSFTGGSALPTDTAPPEPKIIREHVDSIPSLDARVVKVLFFESAHSVTPLPKNTSYQTRFPRATARTVYTEVRLEHPRPGKRIDFSIGVHIRRNGTTFRIEERDSRVEADWTTSYHRIGGAHVRPGLWRPGTYDVDVQINGEKVATGSFEIYE